jgi:hypothetical protein
MSWYGGGAVAFSRRGSPVNRLVLDFFLDFFGRPLNRPRDTRCDILCLEDTGLGGKGGERGGQ